MGSFTSRPGVLGLCLLWGLGLACAGESAAPEASLSVAETLGAVAEGSLDGYARATEVRPFRFPADHGPHPDFRTEWWYFTGNLEGESGGRFGYQLTFFRTAMAPPTAEENGDGQIDKGQELGASGAGSTHGPQSSWRTRQVYMAHLAVTDARGERFQAAERFGRGAAGLAGAEAEPFRVWTGAWRVESGEGARHRREVHVDSGVDDGDGGIFPLRLRAEDGELGIDLTLAGAGKGWVAQGDRGLSRKGPGEGNASYYYSFPRLPTRGSLTLGGDTYRVAGNSWLDREWSTSLLGEGQTGWDWFSLQLDDGREVIAFRIRNADDDPPNASSAPLGYVALVHSPDEEATTDHPLRLLDASAARLRATGSWTSPKSGISWPSGWRLTLPDANLDLTLEPILKNQELNLAFRYWEGAVRVEGIADGRPVTGWGYAELTGYEASRTSANKLEHRDLTTRDGRLLPW